MFGPKTVDSVLKVFTKALDDLAEVRVQQATLAQEKDSAALVLASEAADARSEALRAAKIEARLKEIVGG